MRYIVVLFGYTTSTMVFAFAAFDGITAISFIYMMLLLGAIALVLAFRIIDKIEEAVDAAADRIMEKIRDEGN